MKKTLGKGKLIGYQSGGRRYDESREYVYCSTGVNRTDCQHFARLPDYRANVKGRTVTRLGDKKNHETGRFKECSVYKLCLIQPE